jgi:Na+/melibiose symporter-like transporter
MAWISIGIGFIFFFLMIPGVWENKGLRQQYSTQREMIIKSEYEGFFSTAWRVIRDRRFMVKVIFFFGYQAAAALIQASGPYFITFVINEESQTLTFILGAMLLGALVSVYFWLRLAKKVNNNKKMSLYAGWAMCILFIPIMFSQFTGLIGLIIWMLLWGIGLGGQWFMDPPTMGDVLDDLTVRNNKRENSIYYGWNAFFIRLSGVFTAVVFGIVHPLTGFVEGTHSLAELQALSPTPELAVFGIVLQGSVIPAILVLITIFIFWKWYDITPELVEQNKDKLRELGL